MIRVVWGTARDGAGHVILGGNVTAYIHGQTTPTTIYLDSGATQPVSSVTTNALDGSFIFYVSDSGLVIYDVQVTGTGFVPKLYQYINPIPITGGYPVASGGSTNITGIVLGNGSSLSGNAIPTGLLKANGTAISAAVSATDYCPATSGSSILKGSSGGTAAATYTDIEAIITNNQMYAYIQSLIHPASIAAQTSTFTLTSLTPYTVVPISSSNAVTVNIPAASSSYSGYWYEVWNMNTGVVTPTLASGNWWGTSSIGTTFALPGRARIWCDGTNWYATPIYVPISLQSFTTTATSPSSTSLATYVPPGASMVWGSLLNSTAPYNAYVCPNSNQYGVQEVSAGIVAPFMIPMQTPQTVYLWSNNGSGTAILRLTGFVM